ncbi:MAG: hypothetical protein ABSE57_07940 [Bryobacteraceae bacterium]
MIFSAFLAWRLGSMAKKGSKEVKMLGWSVVVWQIPGVVLSFLYFGVPPMILGTPVTVLVGVAAADVHVKRATPA